MVVLITGGTGYLGGAIVRAVAARGHRPVVFARRASTSGLPGRMVDGDVRDGEALLSAARGADAAIHAAALVSIWRPRREFEAINVGGLRNAIHVCRTLGIPRLVYTSSFLALPPAGRVTALAANDYQRTKAEARAVARQAAAAGAPIVALYPGVIYGPGAATEGNLVGRLVRDHLQGRLPGLIGARRLWSLAFVDDVAQAHVAALTRGGVGAEYALGGENAPPIRIFEIVESLTGRRPPRDIPYAAASLVGLLDEARAALTSRPPRLTRGAVTIFRHDWPLDSRAAIDDLGYRITPLDDGVRKLVEGMAGAGGSGRDGHASETGGE